MKTLRAHFLWMIEILVGCYSISCIGFIVHFNYQYVQSYGTKSWLLGGEILSTLKAIIWPFFL